MSILATRRPIRELGKNVRICQRCGIEHGGRYERCRDCNDAENPKETCGKGGHPWTPDNIIDSKWGARCRACHRRQQNVSRGWEWVCQVCGRRADQGEPLCRGCGQTPANDMDVI